MKRLILGCALVVVTTVVGANAGCLDGDYEVAGNPLLPSPAGALASDVVTIAGDTVAIASGCSAVRFRSWPTIRGTVVRAVWPQCGAVRRVRLRAVVKGTCRMMRGLFVTGRPRVLRRFAAQHEIACPPGEPGCRVCRANDDCSDDSFCAREVGRCDGLGICEQRPTRCPLAFVPVCGCDGVTYAGPCEAAQHDVNVAHPGSCDPRCGGIAGLPCAEGRHCELPAGMCDAADLEGTCVDVPEVCPELYAPVCGCDGVTYSTDCDRLCARVQKAHDGPCEQACRDVCDCYRTRTFPEPCLLECAACDNYWTCDDGLCVPHCGPVPQPPPVCEAKVCGGIAGIGCPDGNICELPAGDCQTTDQQGICVPKPGACPAIYEPVCGCDGITYSNDCERQAVGAHKAHDGPCRHECATRCDCYAKLKLPDWCAALACPACGCVWQCDQGTCVVRVETLPHLPVCDATIGYLHDGRPHG